jgi:hypothetical protein
MKKVKQILSVITLALITLTANAQEATKTKKPTVINLSEDGKHYIKYGMNAQIWGRYTDLNPGTMIGSNHTYGATDIVIRRLRAQAMGMLTDKVFFHLQVGGNNYRFTEKPALMSILDLLGEYHFNKYLHLGIGINGWGSGVSRYSSQSSSTQISFDAPICQQINISETFGNRNYSAYAKGAFGNFIYRLAVTDPYKQTNSNIGTASTPSTLTPKPQINGILTYQFLDHESNKEPYNKFTYFGKKKVLNIGVGYLYQSRAMWRLNDALTDTIFNDMKAFGVDIFYDAPIGQKGAVLTLYGSYNNLDYGKNYTHVIATPNPTTTGKGNGYYGIGTGSIVHTQMAYIFKNNDKRTGRPGLFLTSEIASLQALKTPMVMFEAGINYYITGGGGSKITLGYQNRPLFESVTGETKLVETGRKNMVVLQYQVHF